MVEKKKKAEMMEIFSTLKSHLERRSRGWS